MKVNITQYALKHMLSGLLNDPDIIEIMFDFQISGETEDGYVMRNGSASILFNSTFPYVSYNGTYFDLTDFFDGDITYHDDIKDPDMVISITHCIRK